MRAPPILKVENLEVFYDASQILFDVNLTLESGQILALLGRNGAGKSTTIKAIAGLAHVRSGRVRLREHEVQGQEPYRIAKAGLGYVPEDRQVFPEHTVEDNLIIGAKKGPEKQDYWTLERVYEVFPLLLPLRDRYAGLLSGGEQQMLTIARTLMGNPVVLLLDEPSEGLAPVVVQQIAVLIKRLHAIGVTIVLAEQNMRFCLGVATHAAIIDKGHVVYQDTIANLKADREITKRHLAA